MKLINPKLSLKEIKQLTPNCEIVVFNQHDFYIYNEKESKLINVEEKKEGINEITIGEFTKSSDLIGKHTVKQFESINEALDMFLYWSKNLQLVLI